MPTVSRIKALPAGTIVSVTVLSLLASSTFAEQRTRRRTRLAGIVLREVEKVIRDRVRRSRSRPERVPEEPRRAPPRERPEYAGALVMPVAGVAWDQLRDSFGDPRSGGRRHRGIDIFAPRWTEVLAATSGTLSSIGEGGLAGRSLWLAGSDGRSYFYGHLEDWAGGIYEGMEVGAGHVVGYVGNSGNAARTPTHLHFEVHEDGRAVNPHRVLASAEPSYGTGRVASRRPRARPGG